MAGHLALRSGNPALGAGTFQDVVAVDYEKPMTVMGTVHKTAICLALLMLTAFYTWSLPVGDPRVGAFTLVGFLGGFVLALVTVFKKTAAPYTTPAYALLEGLALGGVSRVFEAQVPGIVNQAVFLTFGTLAALLLAYRSGLIKPTENFKLGVAAATGGIFIFYLISLGLGLFGVQMPLLHSSSPLSILLSLGIVVIAALNLVLDFDFIEQGAERGAPRFMEWYGAFGLLVTLIWLYLEILRLLSKLQSRR